MTKNARIREEWLIAPVSMQIRSADSDPLDFYNSMTWRAGWSFFLAVGHLSRFSTYKGFHDAFLSLIRWACCEKGPARKLQHSSISIQSPPNAKFCLGQVQL